MQYLVGDATEPVGDGSKIIAHICNDVGAWGAGFVLALSKRWHQPEAEYLKEKEQHSLALGTVKLIQVEENIWVANMIAQKGIRTRNGNPPIRYAALKNCLSILACYGKELHATIHMPRIGCGLAGGKWEMVAPLIQEQLRDIKVFVYDLHIS